MSVFTITFRRSMRAAGLLAIFLLLAGCGTEARNAQKVQDTLAEAYRHAQADPNDQQARQWVDRAIALAPNDSSTYLGEENPSPDGLPLSIALIFGEFGVGDDPALADYMQQAIQKFPDDYRGYQILVDTEGRLGREADRKANAAKLVALLNKKLRAAGATDVQSLTLALAQAYWDAGDPVNGAATYQKAIQAYPAEPDPLNNLAYAYAVSNTHLPEALNLAQQAIALARKKNQSDEMIATFQDTLGWVQYRQGDYQGAEQSLQQAANALPRLAEIRYHLGMVYAAEGKTDAARAELGHAVLLSQNYAAAQQALARLPKPFTTAATS